MRLSDVLSKPITTDYVQIEGFLGSRKLKTGNSKKIAVGKVALNYYCNNCGDQRTFYSGEDLFCIGVNEKTVSVDCVLECPRCGASVQMWFLLECREEDNIHSQYPYVRIAKRSEKFSEAVSFNTETYGDFTDALEKARKARAKLQERNWEMTVATAAPAIPIFRPKMNTGSRIMLQTVPMSTVVIPMTGKP